MGRSRKWTDVAALRPENAAKMEQHRGDHFIAGDNGMIAYPTALHSESKLILWLRSKGCTLAAPPWQQSHLSFGCSISVLQRHPQSHCISLQLGDRVLQPPILCLEEC